MLYICLFKYMYVQMHIYMYTRAYVFSQLAYMHFYIEKTNKKRNILTFMLNLL